MRGFSFRQIIIDESGQSYAIANQNTGLAINSQFNFERLSPIKFRKLAQTIDIGLYLFGDIGSVGMYSNQQYNTDFKMSPMLYDAGFGTSMTIKKFWILSGIKPLTFRFDMPLLLSQPADNEANENIQFRWLIGVDQSF